jgi:hypothetical protein
MGEIDFTFVLLILYNKSVTAFVSGWVSTMSRQGHPQGEVEGSE